MNPMRGRCKVEGRRRSAILLDSCQALQNIVSGRTNTEENVARAISVFRNAIRRSLKCGPFLLAVTGRERKAALLPES